MKPNRFYTAGRSIKSRDGRPVVIIQESRSSAHDVTPTSVPSLREALAASKKAWAALWSILKVVGPAIMASTALVISLLSYEDQHGAYQANATANLRHQAEQVSFVQQSTDQQSSESILIDNSSNNPVSNVTFVISLTYPDERTYSMEVYLAAMPACSIGRVTNSMMAAYLHYIEFKYIDFKTIAPELLSWNHEFTVTSMYFTDNNGAAWRYSEDNALKRISGYPSSVIRFPYLPTNNVTIATLDGMSISPPLLPPPSYVEASSCS
jgi:hypothetical protein